MRAIPITNNLLRLGFNHHVNDLNPIRIQKLLYLVHGWHLALTGKPLIPGGFIRGRFGPIITELEDILCLYNNLPVNDYIAERNESTRSIAPMFVDQSSNPAFDRILNTVWKNYGTFTTNQLSALVHSTHSPLVKTSTGKRICDEKIKEYFKSQLPQKQTPVAH